MKIRFKIRTLIFMILVMVSSHALGYELTIVQDRITLHADQVSLKTLMNDLSQKTGIRVFIDPGLDPFISADVTNQDLQDALESILSSLNHALKWESTASSNIRLSEIHIFRQGDKEAAARPQKKTNLNIARNPTDDSFYVRGEILIRLKKGIDSEHLDKIVNRFGGTIISENPNLGIFRIKLPDQTDIPKLAAQIKDLPEMEMAEPNYAYPIATPHRYVIESDIKTDLNPDPLSDGSMAIAILDSGLARGLLPDGQVVASHDALNPGDPISDSLGHGTQMALVASGMITPFGAVAEKQGTCPVIAIRAFDDNGFTSSIALMDGIDFALANGAKVISLSWGSPIKSDFIRDTLAYGASKGLIIVASAGNEPTGKPVFPAAYASVIGIGALAPDGQNWANTNHGNFVDAYLPGFADMPVGYKSDPGIYAGTSISAAFASRKIASFLSQNPKADKKEIIAFLSSKK